MPKPKSKGGYAYACFAVMTQSEAGKRLGISRARIQQLEKSAFKKIRQFLLC
jgi:DNA-directed RNA polymerase specialized sigma subunit